VDLAGVRAELRQLQQSEELIREDSLGARAEALDFLSFAIEALSRAEPEGDIPRLQVVAEELKARLEAIDDRLLARLRSEVVKRRHCPRAVRAIVDRYAGPPVAGEPYFVRYDALDALFDGLFTPELPPQPTLARAPGMVHLDLTPARAILSLVDRLSWGAEDRFYDLGSGLGQVAIAVHLLTGVPACGIEYEPAYCAYAQQSARALDLEQVVFVNQDARTTDLGGGTVFFLFTPFTGEMLTAVLCRLKEVSRRHPIRIASYGPCTPVVARQPWLRSLDPEASHEFRVALFTSCVPLFPGG
jgi:hypothetical protein